MTTSNANNNTAGVRMNRWVLWLTRHWLTITLLILAIYVSLPFAAPILMKAGITGPSNAIYSIYSPLCHQFAFRSWFLFGEQQAYPRAEAAVPGLKPFEAYSAEILAGRTNAGAINLSTWSIGLLDAARSFTGNEKMGYKVALCERDIAIYGALLVAGLIYSLPPVRRQLRPAPIKLYLFLGVLPIAIDGFSQLFSEPPIAIFMQRETTPFFRTLTGILFGLMSAWLAFPYLEESMRITAAEISAKFASKEAALQ